jgi:hypothetical protein
MLVASLAVGHLHTATEREPPRPPHRHQARAPLGNIRLTLSQLAWAHLKAVVVRHRRRLPLHHGSPGALRVSLVHPTVEETGALPNMLVFAVIALYLTSEMS